MSRKLTTLNELAKDLSINKSKLAYYVSIGLIEPIEVLGRMQIFEEDKTMAKLKKIEANKGKKTLREMADETKKKNK